MTLILTIIIILGLLVLGYMIYFLYPVPKNEYFINNSHIYFMNYKETSDFLMRDPDKYIANMSEYDLYARKVGSFSEYKNIISKLTMSFSDEEKILLQKCTTYADNFFKSTDFSSTDYYKFVNGYDLASIPWVFALTTKIDNKEYEEGFPHTRHNIIFLSKQILLYNDIDLTNTLIHEKIHIYQRYNKELFKQIIKNMNYESIEKKSNINYELIRANPDLDSNIYYDKHTNKDIVCLYKSKTPNSINDVKYSYMNIEHPYEKIAYDIAGMYYKNKIDKYKDI